MNHDSTSPHISHKIFVARSNVNTNSSNRDTNLRKRLFDECLWSFYVPNFFASSGFLLRSNCSIFHSICDSISSIGSSRCGWITEIGFGKTLGWEIVRKFSSSMLCTESCLDSPLQSYLVQFLRIFSVFSFLVPGKNCSVQLKGKEKDKCSRVIWLIQRSVEKNTNFQILVIPDFYCFDTTLSTVWRSDRACSWMRRKFRRHT